jgi:uncharacterized protein YhaN
VRIERLHLIRYGALTDREFRFRPGAGLHLLYGPNEAGKSSALAAISDLLFGFSEKRDAPRYDFLHEAKDLRVAASLRASDGRELVFRRRKGRKNTLLADDEAEAPLRDDVLAPFLGGLSREVFELSFGLDSARLKQGGDALIDGEGGEGGRVFAAASGLHGLNALRAALEAEADALFAPRASRDRKVYQVLDRHDAARRAERDRALRAAEWKRLNAEVEAAEAAVAEAEAALAETGRRATRLRKLLALLPLLSRIGRSEAGLAAFADLAGLPAGLSERIGAALSACEASQRALDEATRARDEALARRRAIAVDGTLLAAAGEITALHARLDAYRQRREQLPRIEGEAEAFERALLALLDRLGPGAPAVPESEALRALLPGDAVLADLAARLDEGRDLRRERADLVALLSREAKALEELERQAGGAPARDPAPLRARLAALAPDIRTLEERDRLSGEHQRLCRRVAEQLARLAPPLADPVADADALAAARLPGIEEMGEHRDRFEALAEDLRRNAERRIAEDEEIARLDIAIAETGRGEDMPSAERIRAARAARDAALARYVEADAAARDALRGEVEALLRAADGLADRAIAEADRVSRHAADTARRAALLRQQAGTRGEAERLAGERTRAIAAWKALFAPLGIEPSGVAAMIEWRRAVDRLLEEREEAGAVAARIAALEATASRVRPPLATLAGELGLETGEGEDVVLLHRRVAGELEARGAAFHEGRSLAGRIGDAHARLAEARERATVLDAALGRWRERVDAALVAAGGRAGMEMDAAEALLDVWRELPATLRERDNRAGRVRGMLRDNETFAAEARALAARLAPDLAPDIAPDPVGQGLADAAPDRLVAELQKRLEGERVALTRAEAADEALQRAGEGLERAQGAHQAAAAARAELVAGLPETLQDADLAALAGRLAERDKLGRALAEDLALFDETAEGEARADVAAELEGFDPEAARAELALLDSEGESRTGALKEAHGRAQQALADRRAAEAGEGAESAAFERLSAEAELVELGRQWFVTRLASLLLSGALEHHRARQGDPLLASAGELFGSLTQGAFGGVLREFGEDDRPRLLARRAGGELVGLDGLSEGTRDQLYLALRLAFLADYSARAEAAPFIGDDLFQSFDDARTAAGLRTLAGQSQVIQPILFTHHASVVDIARRELGDRLDLLEF